MSSDHAGLRDERLNMGGGRAVFDPAAAGWTIRDDEPGLITVVGPIWQHGEGENLKFGFLARAEHANRRGVVHGGMLMTFADQMLGTVAIEAVPGRRLATIQLDNHFIAPLAIGDFVEGRARVEHRTRSILFMSGSMFVGERLVATASGIWKVLSSSPEG